MKFRNFFYLWLPVILWCGVIFAFSSIPTIVKAPIVWWDFILKKTAHISEYAILFFLLFRAFKREFNVKKFDFPFWIMLFMFVIFYAISDEYHQSFVPGRTSTLRDIGFDFLGMTVGFWWIKRKISPNPL